MKFRFRQLPVMAAFSAFSLATMIIAFQNCSDSSFKGIDSSEATLLKQGVSDDFQTDENVPLDAQLRSIGKIENRNTEFKILTQPINGQVTLTGAASGSFHYVPNKYFNGHDSFTFSESPNGLEPIVRTANITVNPVNQFPWIITDSFSFEMNSTKNAMAIATGDIESSDLQVILARNGGVGYVKTANGRIEKTDNTTLAYTPDPNFRGTDKVELFVRDPQGGISSRIVSISVGNPFRNVQPAMAVRGMACIACHAKVTSTVITDFGFGDAFFFGKKALAKANTSVFSFWSSETDYVTSYSDHYLGAWSTAQLTSNIIVPNAPIDLDLNRQSYTLKNTAQADTETNRNYLNASVKPGHPTLAATTVGEYVTAIEDIKRKASRPAATAIDVKNTVYIGSPDASTIVAKLDLNVDSVKYFKNASDSPNLSGATNASANGTNYTLATGTVVCDGDLGVRGILFLKDVTIETTSGCRIYVAGPVFQQGEIKYLNHGAPQTSKNLMNLQIISSDSITMGIGATDCESDSNPGWYNQYRKDHGGTAPSIYDNRYGTHSADTRRMPGGGPAAQARHDQLKGFATAANVQDASCRGGTAPRELHFERLMLVAPNIQSRYTGQFTGVIIAEYALFSLSKFTFQFDEVFKQVPVLPVLETSSYLDVK